MIQGGPVAGRPFSWRRGHLHFTIRAEPPLWPLSGTFGFVQVSAKWVVFIV